MDKFLIDYMGTRFEVYGAAAKAVAALVDECAELRAENERLAATCKDYLQVCAENERLREVLDEVVKRLVPLTPVILAAMQVKREGE